MTPAATVSVFLCPALVLPCGFLEDQKFRWKTTWFKQKTQLNQAHILNQKKNNQN